MIGKTRHTPDLLKGNGSETGAARGVLKEPIAAGVVNHWRKVPAPDVIPWIARYWTATWNLVPGEKQLVETLPHPNVYIIFENGSNTVEKVQHIAQEVGRTVQEEAQHQGLTQGI